MTVDKLEVTPVPSLEDILSVVSREDGPFFLGPDEVKGDGYRYVFNDKGAEAYGRLTAILYACHRLTGEYDIESIIDEMDRVASETT